MLDKALIPMIPNPDDPGGADILDEGNFHISVDGGGFTRREFLARVYFDTDGSSGSVEEMTFGGKTYWAFSPGGIQGGGGVSGDSNRLDYDWLNNIVDSPLNPLDSLIGRLDFHISHTAPDGTVTFLSDDSATPWVSGSEYPAGLYEGDANGHPISVIAPVSTVWEEVLAKSDTYIRHAAPDIRFGVDGNKWFNLSNGKGYIKQSGSWVEVTDFALESEIASLRTLEKSAPFHWYTDTPIANPTDGGDLGGEASVEVISRNSLSFYGAANLLFHRTGSKILFKIDGIAEANSAVAAGWNSQNQRCRCKECQNRNRHFSLTGANTADLPFSVEGEVDSLPSDAVKIAAETTGIAAGAANTWLVRDFKIGATVVTDRFLPAIPAAGSRDNKAPVFDGDNLRWETLMGGITDAQIARLLPSLPASGSRDDRFPISTAMRCDGKSLGRLL